MYPGMSDRQYEVWCLMAKGYVVERIALELVIAPSTAKCHIQGVYDVLALTQRDHPGCNLHTLAALAWFKHKGLLLEENTQDGNGDATDDQHTHVL